MKHKLPKTRTGKLSVLIFTVFVILVLITRFAAGLLIGTGAYENVTFISLWRMFQYLIFIGGGVAWLVGFKALIADKDRSLAIIVVVILGILAILVGLMQLFIAGF